MKKYEFTGEKQVVFGITLRRIRAVVKMTFASGVVVNAGDIGGWIEKEDNLDHSGNAWVFGNAMVFENARVCGNAMVFGEAMVCGDAEVCGNAMVFGEARVSGEARVFGNARVCGDAEVCGNAEVFGDAMVCGDAEVCGNAEVCGDAEVMKKTHFLQIGAIGSRNRVTTFFRTKGLGIKVSCGCFYGTIQEFLAEVEETLGDSKHAKVYKLAVELAIAQIEDAQCEGGLHP